MASAVALFRIAASTASTAAAAVVASGKCHGKLALTSSYGVRRISGGAATAENAREWSALRAWVGGGVLVGSGIGAGVVGMYAGADDAFRSRTAFLAFDWAANIASSVLEPESAHRLAVWSSSMGLCPRELRADPASLHTTVLGISFTNPLGLAAGFDKGGECYGAMSRMGFGFVEIGSITPLPQPGNDKPRVFRLRELGAVINRYGFNSEGVGVVAGRLLDDDESRRATTGRGNLVLGINVGKNKTAEDAAADYVMGIRTLGQFADYIVVNVSSPNTPGLRLLQAKKELSKLIRAASSARDELPANSARQAASYESPVSGRGKRPLLVKIAPDLSDGEIADIAGICMRSGVDGIIVSNTTVSREGVAGHQHAGEAGGLSGRPLMDSSTEVLRKVYRHTKGKIPLIGCGGISSGRDAYRKIRAGASLVQIYTALAIEGPGVVPRIKRELAACLEEDGIATVGDAVGLDA